MGTETVVAIPGAGNASAEVFSGATGLQQIVREAPATAAAAPTSWTLSLSVSATFIAADINRRALILTNRSSSGSVFIGYGANTAPSIVVGNYDDVIPPGGRLAVEKENLTLACSFIADVASGSLNISKTTST